MKTFNWYSNKLLDRCKSEQIECIIMKKGYMTYKDFCELTGEEYDERMNELLKQFNCGLPFKDFIRLARKIKNKK